MLSLSSCKINYTFSGASYSADTQTFSVAFFQNQASIVNPSLSNVFTEALKDRVNAQTKLKLVQQNGEEAFPQIREKGKFYTDDFYVFVWKVEGDKITRIVFPPDLSQEGTDVSDYKDDNNVSITKMFVTIANSEKGEGWSGEYLRTNPEDKKIEKKVTYIKKVVYNDTTYILGGGYYLN